MRQLNGRLPNPALNGAYKGGTDPYNHYSRELKREFCLLKMRWLAARTEQGMYRNTWRNDHFNFFKARIPNYKCSETFQQTMRTWWTQRAKYLTTKELEMLTSGCDGGRDPTGTAGIGSEDIDAEQSQAGGAAFPDAAAAEGAFRPATLHSAIEGWDCRFCTGCRRALHVPAAPRSAAACAPASRSRI